MQRGRIGRGPALTVFHMCGWHSGKWEMRVHEK